MVAPAVISLFTGAGGLDYGLEAAGFETRVALDLDDEACETLRANRNWPLIAGEPISGVTTRRLLRVGELRRGEAQLLVGGPPCQPFSKSGHWANGDTPRLADERAVETLHGYLRVLEEAQPETFLLENVAGLNFRDKNEALDLIGRRLRAINRRRKTRYKIGIATLRAQDYGVPQRRERVFLVGSRDGRDFEFPEPTHGEEDGLVPFRTAWDALADVQPDRDEDLAVTGKWAQLLPSIPEGENYLWHTPRRGGQSLFGWRTRYWNFLLKLAKALPSWTLQAQPGPATGPFHWKNRQLSMRELCRLQTMPDDVVVQGTRRAVVRQVGNAVPSLLAEVLGRSIREQLLGGRGSSRRLRLLPPDRGPAPRRSPTRAVPDHYLSLVGCHEEHPGTGEGPRSVLLRS